MKDTSFLFLASALCTLASSCIVSLPRPNHFKHMRYRGNTSEAQRTVSGESCESLSGAFDDAFRNAGETVIKLEEVQVASKLDCYTVTAKVAEPTNE